MIWGNGTMTKEEAVIVELPVDDITVELEPDGLPKTVPVIRDAPSASKVVEADESDEPVADIDALTKERDEFKRESEQRAQEAAEAARVAEQERQSRVQTESKLSEASLTERRNQWALLDAHRQQILGGINTAKMELANAKKAVSDAIAAGDGDRVADAQERLSDARFDLRRLEEGQQGIDLEIRQFERTLREEAERPKTPAVVDQQTQQPPQVRSPSDYINNVRTNLGGKLADWLSENPEFVTNPALNKKALEVVNARIAEGKPLNSSAFIKTLNDTFFAEDIEMPEPSPEPKPKVEAKPAAKPKSVPAAPVSRGGGDFYSSANPAGSKIRLHPVLAGMARDIGLTNEEYAAGIKAEIKKGKLPKTYLDPDYPHEQV